MLDRKINEICSFLINFYFDAKLLLNFTIALSNMKKTRKHLMIVPYEIKFPMK